jgi:hypothetical protein
MNVFMLFRIFQRYLPSSAVHRIKDFVNSLMFKSRKDEIENDENDETETEALNEENENDIDDENIQNDYESNTD